MKTKLGLAVLASVTAIAFSLPAVGESTQPSTKSDKSPTATSTEAAPVPGANSFTEGQAKSHIEEAGYSNVSGLAKDANGIWRGQAQRDGKNVAVALDYQGNVVANAQ